MFQQAQPQPASRVVYRAILCIYTLHTNLDMYGVFKPPFFSIYCCKHCASNQVKSTHEPRKFQDFVTWSLPTLEDGLFLALRKVGGFLRQVPALFIWSSLPGSRDLAAFMPGLCLDSDCSVPTVGTTEVVDFHVVSIQLRGCFLLYWKWPFLGI